MLLRAGLGVGVIGAGGAGVAMGGVALAAGGLAAGSVLGYIAGMLILGGGQAIFESFPDLHRSFVYGSPDAVLTRFTTSNKKRWSIRREDLSSLRLCTSAAAGAWGLEIFLNYRTFQFRGEQAIHLAGRLLPVVNGSGGREREVQDAVRYLEEAGDQQAVFQNAARSAKEPRGTRVASLPHPVRLAMEMAAHEDQERRALEGELVELERAWKEAEEIAAIADRLPMLPRIERALLRVKESNRTSPKA